MKTLGLLGGMSWESTAIYYRLMNEIARRECGGLTSASLILRSFDFAPMAKAMAESNWPQLQDQLIEEAQSLETAGADAIVICTNTMHKMADGVQAAIAIPVIHVADATARQLTKKSCAKPLLLATRFTMEMQFYRDRLEQADSIHVFIPDEKDWLAVHTIIFDELCQGVVSPQSKSRYLEIIDRGRSQHGIDSVIFGCTEIGLLLTQDDLTVPAFDTAHIHAEAAMAFALGTANA